MTSACELPAPRWHKYPVILVLAALCAYFNSFGGRFFLDDIGWIAKNPEIGNLFSAFMGLPRAVVSSSLTLNYWLDGTEPRGYHVVNLAIHILAGLTLFGIVRRTLLLPRWSEPVRERSGEIALVIALLWLV